MNRAERRRFAAESKHAIRVGDRVVVIQSGQRFYGTVGAVLSVGGKSVAVISGTSRLNGMIGDLRGRCGDLFFEVYNDDFEVVITCPHLIQRIGN